MNRTDHIKSTLNGAGIKPSAQRIAVVDYLEQSCGSHPTAEEIYSALRPKYPTLSRTTVYNTVRVLCQAGVLHRVDTGEESQRFDINVSPHAHFICSRCRRLYDIPLPGALAPPAGFEASGISLSFKGLCPDCHCATQSKEPALQHC